MVTKVGLMVEVNYGALKSPLPLNFVLRISCTGVVPELGMERPIFESIISEVVQLMQNYCIRVVVVVKQIHTYIRREDGCP